MRFCFVRISGQRIVDNMRRLHHGLGWALYAMLADRDAIELEVLICHKQWIWLLVEYFRLMFKSKPHFYLERLVVDRHTVQVLFKNTAQRLVLFFQAAFLSLKRKLV